MSNEDLNTIFHLITESLKESYETRIRELQKLHELLIQAKNEVIQAQEKQIAELHQKLEEEKTRRLTLNIYIKKLIDQSGSSFGAGVIQGNMNAENVSGTYNEAPDKD